jgi:hypothetical protein
LSGHDFLVSEKSYDWLGPGVYFWEADPIRAFQWACLPWRKINRPSLVGAVIDFGRCLDLTTQEGIEAVKSAHAGLAELHSRTAEPLPENSGTEKGKRSLDCAVIKHLHRARAKVTESNPSILPYQTVRALFVEGKELYAGAGFHDKTHVQICVIDRKNILGVFRLPAHQQEILQLGVELY